MKGVVRVWQLPTGGWLFFQALTYILCKRHTCVQGTNIPHFVKEEMGIKNGWISHSKHKAGEIPLTLGPLLFLWTMPEVHSYNNDSALTLKEALWNRDQEKCILGLIFSPTIFLGFWATGIISPNNTTCKMNRTWYLIKWWASEGDYGMPGSAPGLLGKCAQFVFTGCSFVCAHLPHLAPLAPGCPLLMPLSPCCPELCPHPAP